MAQELTQEGVYRGKITTWGLRSANTGTVQWVFTAILTEVAKNPDDLAAGWDAITPIKRSVYNAITGATVERVIDEAKSIGFNSTDPLDLDPNLGGDDAHDFEDTQVVLTCSHEEYLGKMKERWQLSRRKEKKLTEQQVEQFAALFGDKFRDRMTPDEGDLGVEPATTPKARRGRKAATAEAS